MNDIKKQANADAGKVDEIQKIIDQQKASAKALLASAKDIKMGIDKLPTPQDPLEKANTQTQVDALALINGADVKKKLDGLKASNLMIEYNKVAYANGKTITISNKEAVSGFTLKNVIEGEDLAWVVKDGDKVLHNFTANPVGLIWPDGKTKLTLEATQGSKKMSLTLQRKTFTFTGLIAIDANSPNRRTKLADETLYLVRSPNDSRTIKYEMTTNAKKNDFVGIEPNWATTIPLNNLYEGKVLTGINSTTGETRHTSESKGSVSAEAFEKTNGVKVEVVNLDKTDYEVLPPATNAALKQLSEATKEYLGKFKQYGGDKIDPEFELAITGNQYNEEIEKLPLYQTKREGSIKMDLGIKKLSVPLPGLSYSVPKIGTIGAYLDFSFNIGMNAKITYEKPVNATKWTSSQTVGFEGNGDIEFGVVAETEVPKWLGQLTLKGYGKTGIFAEKEGLPDLTTPLQGCKAGFNAFVVGVNAILNLGGVDIVNFKREQTLINQTIIWKYHEKK